MNVLKGLLAVFASLFVTTMAYAATSGSALNSLFGTTGIYLYLSIWAMILSNCWFADKNSGGTKCGADASIVALFAAMAAGLGFVAIVALPVSLTNFVAVLAALVVATLSAFFTCASHLTIAVDRKVYVISTVVFYVAMAVCTYIVVFGL